MFHAFHGYSRKNIQQETEKEGFSFTLAEVVSKDPKGYFES